MPFCSVSAEAAACRNVDDKGTCTASVLFDDVNDLEYGLGELE